MLITNYSLLIDKEVDNIEIRSEKVRNLIGEIPPGLVRWGTVIIIVIFIAIIAAVCLLPYPYSDGESIIRHILSGSQLHQ